MTFKWEIIRTKNREIVEIVAGMEEAQKWLEKKDNRRCEYGILRTPIWRRIWKLKNMEIYIIHTLVLD